MPRTKQFDEKEVLNKAMELFWEKGFHATSMQDLVTQLGINRASLYDTFGDKEALFEAAFQLYRQTNGGVIQGLFETEPSVKEGFQKLFQMAIDESVQDGNRKGCFVVNTITELIPGDEKIQSLLLENTINYEKLFTAFVQKGIQNGEINAIKNPNEIGLMLYALFNGIRVLAKVDPNPEKLKSIMKSGLSVLD
ncbi:MULTISPECIES: TetR/AcrR family transcriptional regulator [Croceitalea]|uniref:TetR/AcrR family transcriptional regulator n=1 Tax=Croceitalea vernalis TaxID=3075599 RepID=A0ABU3BF57_9FLAO|nr:MULTISPECIES: TetR/AcrR family transcriptional regulator [unclassified Croceitalea]MDT0539007.1 TetR/AcrR family transcriptional regulator [Croceitalea sp. P059]MDT0620794.1 TetR/AcrR family transcriptional regulator [Croceitalea sp. P007]